MRFADSAYYNPLLSAHCSAVFLCVFPLLVPFRKREKLHDQPSESNKAVCWFMEVGGCFYGQASLGPVWSFCAGVRTWLYSLFLQPYKCLVFFNFRISSFKAPETVFTGRAMEVPHGVVVSVLETFVWSALLRQAQLSNAARQYSATTFSLQLWGSSIDNSVTCAAAPGDRAVAHKRLYTTHRTSAVPLLWCIWEPCRVPSGRRWTISSCQQLLRLMSYSHSVTKKAFRI